MLRSAALLAALLASGCQAHLRPPGPVAPATPPRQGEPVPTPGREDRPDREQRVVLARFAEALRAGRFEEAWPLLSSRWRVALTPSQLASDWRGAGPLAREAAERVLARLSAGAPLEPSPGGRALAVGPGRAARLVEEPEGWRVDALE